MPGTSGNRRRSTRNQSTTTAVKSSVNESRQVTPSKRKNNRFNLKEIEELPTKRKRLSSKQQEVLSTDSEEDSDDDSRNSNSSESEKEEDAISDVTPDNTDLKSYFLENWDLSDFEKRLVHDMADKVCTNDRSFFGMCEAIVKLFKQNNVLRKELAEKNSNCELRQMKHMEKVGDLKAFLKEKTVNLFRHTFIMVRSSHTK